MPIRRLGDLEPRISPRAFVDPTAVLIGDVLVMENASIFPNAVLRGDEGRIVIGRYSNVQDCCILHGSIEIGEYVTVGHGAILHNCRIEDLAVIGAGAIVFDAEVGRGAVVGAGAVVPPGKRVEERSVVIGVPAREMRKLSEEEVEENRRHAIYYWELARRHAESLD